MRFKLAASLLGGIAIASAASSASAFELELRVLVIATGEADEDPGRALLEETLDSMGVPFDVLDSSVEDLTAERLMVSPERGRYNGIILTEASTVGADGTRGFDLQEFSLLHDYESSFAVRESILSGSPVTQADLDLDFGMDEVTAFTSAEARWQSPAGGDEIFEYVNTASTLPIDNFSFAAVPRDDGAGPVVEPLLVDAESPEQALISRLSYEDGREVLLSSVANADFLLHSRVLAYEFINFATSGLFIGSRHVYLSVHNDDLFLADALWDPENQREFSENFRTYRLTPGEVTQVVAAQTAFRERHPLAPGVIIELAFNGVGSDLQSDPLTQAIVQQSGQLAFINHTFQALQMDYLCNGRNTNCVRTDVDTAVAEISENAQRWADLGLPNPERALLALLTDSHSGLEDRRGTLDDPSDDIPFPDGFNPALGSAAQSLGIRLLAGDASRPNQTRIQRVPGFDLVLLPRHPTALFYNVTNPTELESEYNFIFHDSYLADGEDPCDIPEALCEPRSYDEILDEEALVTFEHMLSAQPFPHYFHQTNLHVYDSAGNILQFDWLERVLALYERWITLPVQSPLFHELVDVSWNTVLAREANPIGVFDSTTGSVTLSASAPATIEVTGVAGGADYGGQSIASVSVSPVATVRALDPALDR